MLRVLYLQVEVEEVETSVLPWASGLRKVLLQDAEAERRFSEMMRATESSMRKS